MYSVAPGIFAITEPRQAEGVNSFLIVGSKRAVLFDSGLGVGRISDVVRRLTALPVTVLNSHTHFDHVGGNREFQDVRNLDISYSAASARGEISEELRAYASETLVEERVCGSLPSGVTSRDYVIPTWRIAANVVDGDRLDLGDRTIEVLQTPGHTPDSLCLLDAANGLLFTGDTYYSGEVYLWAPETVVADYTASIARLAGLAPGLKLLMPAHGPPVADPNQLLELQKALKDIEAGTVRSEPTTENRRLFRFEHFSILMDGSASPRRCVVGNSIDEDRRQSGRKSVHQIVGAIARYAAAQSNRHFRRSSKFMPRAALLMLRPVPGRLPLLSFAGDSFLRCVQRTG